MKKGILITFEGSDGSSKTTQIERVKTFLESKNEKVFTNDSSNGHHEWFICKKSSHRG